MLYSEQNKAIIFFFFNCNKICRSFKFTIQIYLANKYLYSAYLLSYRKKYMHASLLYTVIILAVHHFHLKDVILLHGGHWSLQISLNPSCILVGGTWLGRTNTRLIQIPVIRSLSLSFFFFNVNTELAKRASNKGCSFSRSVCILTKKLLFWGRSLLLLFLPLHTHHAFLHTSRAAMLVCSCSLICQMGMF